MKEVRWGIIGTGNVAEFKSGPAFNAIANSRLVAVMNRLEDKAKSFAERHDSERYYSSVDRLLEDEEVNAIYIATPPDSHPNLVQLAASAGKHVLCEKPMAISVAECSSMIAACDRNRVQLMIAYYRRFFPVVLKMKDLLSQGSIGEPIRVHASCGSYKNSVGDEREEWRINPAISGGGFLVDVGTHRLDLMCMFFGAAKEVSALIDSQTLDIEVDDAASLLIKFEGGVHGSLATNWNAGARTDYFEIQGTKGRMYTESLSDDGILILETGNSREQFSLPAPRPVHLNLVQHFVDCLLVGKGNELDGEQGIRASQITEAAYRSAKLGKFVTI